MAKTVNNPAQTDTLPTALRKEVRNRLIAAIAAGVVAGIGAALLSAWAIVQRLPLEVGLVPAGTVAAFDLEGSCPGGWAPFSKAWGRFIVGAVEQDSLGAMPGEFREDARGEDISPRPFGKPGGEEKHLLKEAEMPNHGHSITVDMDTNTHDGLLTGVSPGAGRERGILSEFKNIPNKPSWTTVLPNVLEKKGGGLPHDIMPPYVALSFCRKK